MKRRRSVAYEASPQQAGAERQTVDAFARLFEAVHEGVYIGTIRGDSTETRAANPHLKPMFGFAADAPEGDVRPFETDRFLDPQARDAFIARLERDGSVTD